MKSRISSKYFLLIISALLLFSLFISGCKEICYWEIGGSLDEIEKIEIIEIRDFYKNDFEIICEIDEDNYEELINDVADVQFKSYFNDPLTPKGKAVKITFKNGNYDLISRIEPRHCYKEGDGFKSKTTYLSCVSTEFEQLIEKWTTE